MSLSMRHGLFSITVVYERVKEMCRACAKVVVSVKLVIGITGRLCNSSGSDIFAHDDFGDQSPGASPGEQQTIGSASPDRLRLPDRIANRVVVERRTRPPLPIVHTTERYILRKPRRSREKTVVVCQTCPILARPIHLDSSDKLTFVTALHATRFSSSTSVFTLFLQVPLPHDDHTSMLLKTAVTMRFMSPAKPTCCRVLPRVRIRLISV